MHSHERSRFEGTGVAKEAALAALAFALLALAFLARPIALSRTHTYASVDAVAQSWSATRDPEYDRVPHEVLRDPVVQFLPWTELNASELRAARWPLWNPANGAGVPHLANYQSAVLSPFSLPAYLFGTKAGLILSAFAKLLCCGLFTFLFLRELGLARGAAAFGACAFAYSGFPLLWIQYPHTSVLATLPAALFFAERALRAIDSGERVPPGAWAGLALSLAAAIFAGHPETLFFCGLVVLVYCIIRLDALAWRLRSDRVARSRAVRGAGSFLVLALLATGLGACQLLPFFEYLGHSAAVVAERHAGRGLRANQWAALLFPNLVGTPADGSSFAYNLPGPNYQEFNSFHVAGSVIFLTLVCAPLWWRDVRARAFAALAVIWALYAWDPFGLTLWLASHTALGHVLVLRTHPLWLLPICALGAFAVDRLSRVRARRAWAFTVVLGGALILALFRSGAATFFRYAAHEVDLDASRMPDGVAQHVALTMAAFAVGVCGAALVAVSPRAWCARLGATALVLGVLVESAIPFLDYVPSVPDRMSYPETAAVRELALRTHGEPVLFFTTDAPVPDANMAFDLSLVSSYDALEIDDQARLATEMFGDVRRTLFARKKGLELYGVRFVVARGDWLAIDTSLGEVLQPKSRTTPYLLPEVLASGEPAAIELPQPASELALRFRGARDGLDGACLWFLDDPQALASRAVVTLREIATKDVLAQREFALGDLRSLVGARRELVLECAPMVHSEGALLELSLRSLASAGGARVRVLEGRAGRTPNPSTRAAVDAELPLATKGELLLDGRHVDEGIALDLAYGRSLFRHVARVGEQELFEYLRSPGRAWLVGRAQSASSHEDAWELVRAADFDPLASVVLEDAPPLDLLLSRAEVASDERTPTTRRLRTRTSEPACLVLAQAWFPGWTARVDGLEQTVLRANYAMSAVLVPAGEHEVVLEYRPGSFRLGLLISIASAIVGAIAWAAAARTRRTA